MRFKIIILLFTFSILKIFATGQEPDKIIINNKEYDLLNNPLEKYFQNHPEYHPIYGPKLSEFKKYSNGERMLSFSTSNARDYIATFTIEKNRLSVVDIKIKDLNSEGEDYISVYKKLFGDQKIVLGYSGILVIPTGDLLETADFGYSSLYSQYKLMTINKDKVVKEKELNKDEFMKFRFIQFGEYKKSEDYKIEMKNYLKDWEAEKKSELSTENIKRMSKKELAQLKREYAHPPTQDYIDGYFFVSRNPDFIIVDY